LHYFVLVFNGSGLFAVAGRDKDATWRTTGAFCRERGWSKARLLYELQNGLPYRTFPPGYTFDWSDPYLKPYLNVEASEISFPSGVVMGAINDAVAVITGKPRPPKRRSALEGMTLGIEVLPPGAPADADAPPPSADAPAPPQRKPPSIKSLQDCILAIREGWTSSPPDRDKLRELVESRLNRPVGRDLVDRIRKQVAPQWVNPRGRRR
jgi:hypothetical protein